MKTKWNVWTKGPYGPWEKASADPLTRPEAEQLADVHRAGKSELIVVVCDARETPSGPGGTSG